VSGETLPVYLGIDPGLCTTGYGVLRFGPGMELLDAGTIRSRSSDSLPGRLNELYSGLVEVIDTFHPVVMGLEEVFSHYGHPSTAISMAHARGVLCLAGARRGLRIVSMPPATIKKLITGNGRAGKEQVSGMVRRLLGIREPIRPSDVTDALAIAIAAYESERNDREHPGHRRGC
jgi:crossover junction endodeoxyribonuclease RuvC